MKLEGELWDDLVSSSSQNAHLVSKATRLWESILARKSKLKSIVVSFSCCLQNFNYVSAFWALWSSSSSSSFPPFTQSFRCCKQQLKTLVLPKMLYWPELILTEILTYILA